MSTLKELMGDLTRGDGRKFTHGNDNHDWFEPIFLNGKQVVWFGLDSRGYGTNEDANDPNDWIEWHPPKKTKKITLWRAIIKQLTGGYSVTRWTNTRDIFISGSDKFVGWDSHEVEIDVDE